MKRILIIIIVVIGITLVFTYFIYLSLKGYAFDSNGWNKANYKNEAIDNIESQLNSYIALSKLDNNNFEIVDISHLYGKLFGLYYKPNTGNVFIGFIPKSDSLSRRIVVINPQGEEIGLVESDSETYQVEDFILTNKGYYHFNSHLPVQFVEYKDTSSSITGTQDVLDIYEESEFFIHSLYDNQNDTTKTYLFFNENSWKKITITEALAPSEYLDWKTSNIHYFNNANNYELPIVVDEEKNYKVRLDYFEKQKYFKKKHASYGSPTGTTKLGHWLGTGYFTLFMGDKSLKIKVRNTKLYSEKLASSITINGKKDLDYIIWRSSIIPGERDNSRTYIIK